MKILETERLILREWELGDEKYLKFFLGDNRVMYAYEGVFSDDRIALWLEWNLESYKKNGYGLWAIELKNDGKVIGECGLTNQEVEGEIYKEIGYHLIFDEWHNGYAVEAARAVKEYAFNELKVREVVSTVRNNNITSMNVAIRNGMTVDRIFNKSYKGIDMPHFLFKVENSNSHNMSE
ncbi:GNAT family N-acetyltransferase [Floricoccus penangensis]|uniref:GNAT family N-acetyltransferase n=1 Tax=Floricoccus penangensis TaxID=1859475 RepID=A0A9Q5JGT3_9LACT|nr:GNAT family N-acetyltransferase [Floricoccus penangensis]OFI46834.1 GNAT family N-acetyltransferase [Floricoccus penangensis]